MAPGDHTLTFERAGFATVVREGIEVRLAFTATVNVEMSPDTWKAEYNTAVTDALSVEAHVGGAPTRVRRIGARLDW